MEILEAPAVSTDTWHQQTFNKTNDKIYGTNTVVIGNGPAGLSLSAFLTGWLPFYDPSAAHPNKFLHETLSKTAHMSLLHQDLSWMNDWVGVSESLHSPARGPLAILVDSLCRPDADLHHVHPNCIRWQPPNVTKCRLPHLVVGQGTPGGSWADFSPSVRTLSLGSWLDLPGITIQQFLDSDAGKKYSTELQTLESPLDAMVKENCNWPEYCNRLPSWAVHAYYNNYPYLAGISENILSHTTVKSMKPISIYGNAQFEYRWELELRCADGSVYTVRCNNVVMATGFSTAKSLPECVVERAAVNEPSDVDVPSMVVGGGLSAADAVLELLLQDKPVVHCFRRLPKQIKNTMLGRLSKSLYPEYHAVARLMMGRSEHPLYQSYPGHQVLRLHVERNGDSVCGAELRSEDRSKREKIVNICDAFVRIGSESQLAFVADAQLRHSLHGCAIDAMSYEYVDDSLQGVFAVGSFAGDKFVRYLVGGCLAAARKLYNQ